MSARLLLARWLGGRSLRNAPVSSVRRFAMRAARSAPSTSTSIAGNALTRAASVPKRVAKCPQQGPVTNPQRKTS